MPLIGSIYGRSGYYQILKIQWYYAENSVALTLFLEKSILDVCSRKESQGFIDADITKHYTPGKIAGYARNTSDVLKTAVLAATGAVVSFFISMFLRYCIRKWRK